MSELTKESIEVEGANVPFFTYTLGEDQIFEFDTSKCGPPDPMVNAMVGLQLLDDNSQLIMINHKAPGGLFPKVEAEFNYEIGQTQDAMAKIIFTKKSGVKSTTDFASNQCGGN